MLILVRDKTERTGFVRDRICRALFTPTPMSPLEASSLALGVLLLPLLGSFVEAKGAALLVEAWKSV